MKKTNETAMYDSRQDTLNHINMVISLGNKVGDALIDSIELHDFSKLSGMEKECFDMVTPLLKGLTYGGDEYKDTLKQMKPALEHHYQNNRHHPEHFENGVNDMTLLDLLEMIIDWYCATKRHDDGDIYKSLEINKGRFGISDQLIGILKNTVDLLISLEEDKEMKQ
jgi:hypothetical protein